MFNFLKKNEETTLVQEPVPAAVVVTTRKRASFSTTPHDSDEENDDTERRKAEWTKRHGKSRHSIKTGSTGRSDRDIESHSRFHEEVDLVRQKINQTTFGCLDPNSKHLRRWDLLGAFMLLFVALVTPFEIAFLKVAESPWEDPLFLMNRVVDTWFIIDMRFVFVTPYMNKHGRYIYNHREIFRRYLKGWFVVDFVATIPYDLINVRDAKLLRVLRLLKTVKILRVLRSVRIFNKLQNRISISFSIQKLVKFSIVTLFVAHWLACLWGLSAKMGDIRNSWVYSNGFEDCCTEGWNLYVVSLYWATTTISTVGYGDITPTKDRMDELMMTSVCITIGATTWAYMTGVMCGVVATFNPQEIEFRSRLDELNIYMKEHHFPYELREKLREYFVISKPIQIQQRNQSLITNISPALQDAVVNVLNEGWMPRNDFIVFCSRALSAEDKQDFSRRFFLALDTQLFSPGEHMAPHILSIVRSGLVAYQGRILKFGTSWGEDALTRHSQWLANDDAPVALTHSTISSISNVDLQLLLRVYPGMQANYNRYAMAIKLKRVVRKIIRLNKEVNRSGAGTLTYANFAQTTKGLSLTEATPVPISLQRSASTANIAPTTVASSVINPLTRRKVNTEAGLSGRSQKSQASFRGDLTQRKTPAGVPMLQLGEDTTVTEQLAEMEKRMSSETSGLKQWLTAIAKQQQAQTDVLVALKKQLEVSSEASNAGQFNINGSSEMSPQPGSPEPAASTTVFMGFNTTRKQKNASSIKASKM